MIAKIPDLMKDHSCNNSHNHTHISTHSAQWTEWHSG